MCDHGSLPSKMSRVHMLNNLAMTDFLCYILGVFLTIKDSCLSTTQNPLLGKWTCANSGPSFTRLIPTCKEHRRYCLKSTAYCVFIGVSKCLAIPAWLPHHIDGCIRHGRRLSQHCCYIGNRAGELNCFMWMSWECSHVRWCCDFHCCKEASQWSTSPSSDAACLELGWYLCGEAYA